MTALLRRSATTIIFRPSDQPGIENVTLPNGTHLGRIIDRYDGRYASDIDHVITTHCSYTEARRAFDKPADQMSTRPLDWLIMILGTLVVLGIVKLGTEFVAAVFFAGGVIR